MKINRREMGTTVDSEWNCPVTGFEPRISGVGSDHSTNCATTIAFGYILFWLYGGRPAYPVLWGKGPWALVTVWPDLAKSRHFGKSVQVFSKILKFISYFAKSWA